MSAFVDAIVSTLTTAGVLTAGWPANGLAAQDEPDTVVTIYETDGPDPEQASDRRWRRPTFQVAVRGSPSISACSSSRVRADPGILVTIGCSWLRLPLPGCTPAQFPAILCLHPGPRQFHRFEVYVERGAR
jgi:hypothetical protein